MVLHRPAPTKQQIAVQELGFAHLHLPTVDFLFSPVRSDLHKGVDFIEGEEA